MNMRFRYIACIALVMLFNVLLCSLAFSQTDTWQMFRQDDSRSGVTLGPGGVGVLGPNYRPRPIWVYPAVQPAWNPIDNPDTAPGWTSIPPAPIEAISPYNDTYLYTTTTDIAGAVSVTWNFDFSDPSASDGLNHAIAGGSASFFISVWIPARGNDEDDVSPVTGEIMNRVTDAHYNIYINRATNPTAVATAILDQTDGGDWTLLGSRPFTVNDGDILTVELTSMTEILIPDPNFAPTPGNLEPPLIPLPATVFADAITLEQEAGQIYASPVLLDNPNPLANQNRNVLVSGSSSAVSFGGQTRFLGWITGIGAEADSGIAATGDDRGIRKWRYPLDDRNWISGGISSSATIFGGIPANMAAVPAGDGQVYVLDASLNGNQGSTLWHGPGYYLYNPIVPLTDGTELWVTHAPGGTSYGYQQDPGNTAEDAYFDVQAIDPVAIAGGDTPSTATWTESVTPLENRSYRVEAWIPPSGANAYVTDAKYSVTVGSGTPHDVFINQQAGGAWVSLGSYSLSAGGSTSITVILSNETGMDQSAQTYWVVADALRIVPAELGSFEFSSPIVVGSDIYVGSTGGRVYKFIEGQEEPVWTFPKPDKQPIGGVYASLSRLGGHLYVGSSDGHVYCLDTANGNELWVYPYIPIDGSVPEALAEISSTAAVGNPAGDNMVYVATGGWGSSMLSYDAEGRIIALREKEISAGVYQGQEEWVYPAKADFSAGSFLYASPLYMARATGDPLGIYVGSTDGYFYGVNADTVTVPSTTQKWNRIDLGDTIMSSAAGTRAEFPREDGTPHPVSPFGIAFVNSGSEIYAVDLTAGQKEGWHWGLMSTGISSPAIYRQRIYTGDMRGYVWAFSTAADPVGGGAEGWNPDTGMSGPPTTGSEGEDDPSKNRKSREAGSADYPLRIDVFSGDDYDNFIDAAKTSRDADATGAPQAPTAINSTYDPENLIPVLATDRIHEWGEDFHIIVWGILDPNGRYLTEPPQKPDGSELANPNAFIHDIEPGHQVEITIKSREPGRNADSTDTKRLTGKQIDWYQDSTGYATWYVAYTYVLDGSSSSNYQTPGKTLNIGVRETPVSPDKKSDLIWIDADRNPATDDVLEFGINNPLGIVFEGQLVGMQSATTTQRALADAQINGNPNWPLIWGGITPHKTPSQAKNVGIIDRSLLGANRITSDPTRPARRITKFRVERHSLRWTGQGEFLNASGGPNPDCRVVNPIPAWEMPPQDRRLNRPNISLDYPDISVRQVATNMTPGGQDPSQARQELTPTNDNTTFGASPPPASWNTQGNGLTAILNVPRFQPANMPLVTSAPDPETGYAGEMFAFVDSNNNGVFDKPASLGIGALQTRSAEAYRAMSAQVHVPVDRRVELGPERVNLGELPHGFGFTDDGSGVPYVFTDALQLNLGTLSPPGFGTWFQTVNAENVGNTNLLNVNVQRTPLLSDTVQYPSYDPSTGLPLPGSGHYVPDSCLISTLDGILQGRPGFLDPSTGVPPVLPPPNLPANQRTSHKPRVGGQPTELKVPDVPSRLPGSGNAQLPAVGVAVPLGQPAGTYYGRIRLLDLHPDPNDPTPVSNPIEIVAKVTEGRLTDGYTLAAPHLPHLDNPNLPNSPPPSGDATPAAVRDRDSGNIYLYWATSRYGDYTRGGTVAPTTMDPWYICRSTLTWEGTLGTWIEPSGTQQWWEQTRNSSLFPDPTSIATYFPAPPLGASGTVLKGSVKFSSPAVATDEVSKRSWLLFTGQAYKDDPARPGDKQRLLESRIYYSEIDSQAEPGKPLAIYSTSPKPTASTDNIAGEWTTPKLGVRGIVLRRAGGSSPELWSFWYGGSADRWRIYYNVNPTPNNHTTWTSEAALPVPKGLSSAAEPSPLAWWHPWDTRAGTPLTDTAPFTDANGVTADYSTFDMVYSAYSTFHKNADIYMSRYRTQPPAPTAKDDHWPVALALLPQRRGAPVNVGGANVMCDKLTRDATRGVWYSRDVDWDSTKVSFYETAPEIPSFEVYVQLDPADPNTIYQLNIGKWTRDATSGAIAFQYNVSDLPAGAPAPIIAQVTNLRTLFRALVINPADGTVKFLQPPDANALVYAKYRPRAYRLTDDPAGDTAPCAIADYYDNRKYMLNDPDGNPFYVPSGWSASVYPPTDRLWALWRRPGVGICYKTIRYMVQLKFQIGLDVNEGDRPAVTGVTGIGAPIGKPIEIDWTKNRLYFSASDAVAYKDVTEGGVVKKVPVPNQVQIAYTDAAGNSREDGGPTDTPVFVQMVDEEIGPSGKTFGNLTNISINESQVGAFKDPWDNKVWVFWTSTRAGNPDLYYETISPMFSGVRFTASP